MTSHSISNNGNSSVIDQLPPCVIPPQNAPSNLSICRKLNQYLEIVHMGPKGYGIIALRPIKPRTMIHFELPIASAIEAPTNPLLKHQDIARAYASLSEEKKARFDLLHEGKGEGGTRETRIWNVNSFADEERDGQQLSVVYLEASRFNHSCVPNASYSCEGFIRVHTNCAVEAGEEVAVNYGCEFRYKTGAERIVHLRYNYGFTCTCPVCFPSPRATLSDKRRSLLREITFCGTRGQKLIPEVMAEFAKRGSDTPLPEFRHLYDKGFPDGLDMQRPGTMPLLRKAIKLRYDEYPFDRSFYQSLFYYAIGGLGALYVRRVEMDDTVEAKEEIHAEAEPLAKLLVGSHELFSETGKDEDIDGMYKAVSEFWNVRVESMTSEEAEGHVASVMDGEPDPLDELGDDNMR